MSRTLNARVLRAPKKIRSAVAFSALLVVAVLVAGCQMPYTKAVEGLQGVVLNAPLLETGGTSAQDVGPKKLAGTIASSGVSYGVKDTLAVNEAEQRALRLAPGTGWVRFPHQDDFNLSTESNRQWMAMLNVRSDVTSGYPILLSKGDWKTNGFAVFADPASNAIGFIVSGQQYAWTGAPLDTTKNIAVDWDGSSLRFFVNGAVIGESKAASKQVTDAGPLTIGTTGGITVSKVVVTNKSARDRIPGLFKALGEKAGPSVDTPGGGVTTTTTAPAPTTTTTAPPTTTTTTPPTTTPPTNNGAKLLWSDEFNTGAGAGVDTSTWEQQVGAPTNNGRVEYLTGGTRNVATDGKGNLVITSRKEDFGGRSFTSGRIESTKSFTTGYLEFRAKVPTWQGTMPGLWTYGAAGYGSISGYSEIDALEIQTANDIDPTSVRQTVHGVMGDGSTVWQLGWSQNRVNFAPSKPGDAWHTYGAYVNPSDQSVTFYVDGVAKTRYAKGQQPGGANWPYGVHAQKVIIETEMGGYSRYPTTDKTSDTLQVDYVRTYDRPPY